MAKSISRYLADISSTTGVLDGTLSTAAQTNITSLGTLSSLTVSGSAAMTLTTAAQPNITSVGTLSTLAMGGSITRTGDLTLDVSGDIILDADGGDVFIDDAGTRLLSISNAGSNNVQISTSISDGDLLFKGNDGGSTITALTLDMSEGGIATFAAKIHANKGVNFYTTDDQANYWVQYTHTDDTFRINYNGAGNDEVVINTSGNVGIGTASPGTLLHLYNSSNAQITFQNSTTGTTVGSDGYDITLQGSDIYHILRDSGNQRFYTAGTERLRITSDGTVGIGTTSLTSWGSGYKSLQIGDRGYVAAHTGSDLYLGQNAYFNSAWKYEASVAASLTQHSGGQITHFVAAAGTADNAITWTRALHIKSNGHVGLNSDNPYSQFEIVSTSTAGYTLTGFNTSAQIGIKMPDNNGGYAGIRFTNVGGNYEGFIGFTQTTASPSTKADFVVQGYNRDATAYQEKFRITDGGEISTPQNPVFICTGTGGSWTAISGVNILTSSSFWNVEYDRGNNFTSQNGRFVAPVTGYYLFVFHSYTRANNTSGYVYPNFYVNGTLWQKGSNSMIQHYVGHGDEDMGVANTAHIYLTADQYVQVGFSAHGNSNPISYYGAGLGFSGHLIG